MNLALRSLPLAAAFVAAAAQAAGVRTDQIVVRIRPGFSDTVIAARLGGTVAKRIPQLNAITVRIPNMTTATVATRARAATRVAGVRSASPDIIGEWLATPNDPDFATRQYGPQRVNGPLAWDLATGSLATFVAIADSGCDVNHPDLAPKLVPGARDFGDGDNNVSEQPGAGGHGTHCNGIAGAATNNGIGIASIGYNIGLLALKVGRDVDGGPNLSATVDAIVYAADRGARAVSLSLSLGTDLSNPLLNDAVRYALSKNCLPVAATGNSALNIDQITIVPASIPGVLAVSATDRNDRGADFTNYGNRVDVSAPGVEIWSTLPGNTYGAYSGTSMACPLVAGAVGLMAAYNPRATTEEIRRALKITAQPTLPIGGRQPAPRIDVANAMQIIKPDITIVKDASDAWTQIPRGDRGQQGRLIEVDGSLLEATGVTQPIGNVVVAMSEFDTNHPEHTLTGASLRVSARVNSTNVTHQIFVFNTLTGRYDLIRQAPIVGGAPSVIDFGRVAADRPLKPSHIASSGKITFMIRALRPRARGNGLPLIYGLDQFAFDGRYRPN